MLINRPPPHNLGVWNFIHPRKKTKSKDCTYRREDASSDGGYALPLRRKQMPRIDLTPNPDGYTLKCRHINKKTYLGWGEGIKKIKVDGSNFHSRKSPSPPIF